MSTQRQPKGVPVGGQFAASEHDEAAPINDWIDTHTKDHA